jgi:hypothetical protein
LPRLRLVLTKSASRQAESCREAIARLMIFVFRARAMELEGVNRV